jgi:hypothetical protein
MTTSTHRAPEDILGALEHASNPMFLLSVGPKQEFRFVGANAAHSQATGLTSSRITAKRPDEVFPRRIADIALANYRECCARGSKYTIDENLDSPAGRVWWLTTIAPIFGANGIHAIVGSSTDITALKERAANKSLEYQRLRTRADRWNLVAANAAENARGPLNNILNLSRMLQGETKSPEDTDTIAALLEDTAARSLQKLDNEANEIAAKTFSRTESVDFGQLCREFAAQTDPQANLEITFSDRMHEVDEAITRLLMSSLADQASMHAATFVRIKILPSPIDVGISRLIFDFDALPKARVNLARLGTICRLHGVNIRHVSHNSIHRVEFLLPITRHNGNIFAERGTERLRVSA